MTNENRLYVRLLSALETAGFDRARLLFAVRTALAACLAVLVAWLVGLEHPQWAGMTVWAASQPTRGQLLEKSFFRVAGTIAGAFAGIALMLIADGNAYIIVAGLAIWVGLCAAIGNLQRGFVSYGTIVAGYSAAMVTLLDTAHPEHVAALGFDRVATILTGVFVSILFSWLFIPSARSDAVSERLLQLTGRLLSLMVLSLGEGAGVKTKEQTALLSELAALDDALEPHGAGSLRSRRFVRSARAVLISELAALMWLRDGPLRHWPTEVSAALSKAADAALSDTDPEAVLQHLTEALRLCDRTAEADGDSGLSRLEDVLMPLADAMSDYHAGLDEKRRRRGQFSKPVVLHHDVAGARQAGIRAFAAMLTVGLVWAVTGIASGPYMLLGLSIMVSMFSTFENPAAFMPFVFLGQAAGAAASVFCRWVLWPHAGSEFELILLMFPLVIAGAFVMGHRRTVKIAFDYNMVFLLLSTPALPLHGTFAGSLAGAASVSAAPLIALVIYRLIYPTDARRRVAMLVDAVVLTTKKIAADPDAIARREVERARLYHRTLRLVRWQEKLGRNPQIVADGGLAALNLATVLYALHAFLEEDAATPERARSTARAALRAVSRLDRDPSAVARVLHAAAQRMALAGLSGLAGRLEIAGNGVAQSEAFFRSRRTGA